MDGIVDTGNVIMQQSRHNDDHSIYVHMGNTVTEMNPYSPETKESMRRNPEFFKERLEYLRREVRELGRLYKEMQEQDSKEQG